MVVPDLYFTSLVNDGITPSSQSGLGARDVEMRYLISTSLGLAGGKECRIIAQKNEILSLALTRGSQTEPNELQQSDFEVQVGTNK